MTTKTDTKVTPGEIVSSTRKYSNKDDSSRRFDISADVNIQNGSVTNFNNGQLTADNSKSANFSKGEGWFAFNSSQLEGSDLKEAFEATLDFIQNVNDNVNSNQE